MITPPYRKLPDTILLTTLLLLSLIIFYGCSSKDLPVSDLIRLNQIGFYLGEDKIGVVASEEAAYGKFYVRHIETGKIVYKGKLSSPRSSSFSNKKTAICSFSEVDAPGTYQIEIPSVGKSYPFEIKENLLGDISRAGLKAFYYQRTAMPIEEQYAGKWHRPAGHPDDSVLIHPSAASPKRPAGSVISSPKGWYDAGDYNKYIVNSSFTVGVLLSLFEDFPEYLLKVNTNIPESNDEVPDILDEIWWNISWMLTMQDPNDGGVYHKLTTPEFEDFIEPIECKKQRYVVAKSVTAALGFAASMAQASRIYGIFDTNQSEIADQLLVAAKKAFDWALKNPTALYKQSVINENYSPKILTGEYGDRSTDDEFFRAAVELYLSTGEDEYLSVIEGFVPEAYTAPTWSRVYGLGAHSLIRYGDGLDDRGKALAKRMKEQLLTYVKTASRAAETSPYAAPYGNAAKDFFWGCNSDAACSQGMAFIYAYIITADRKYLTYALHNMDYLLGRNATGYCYVTGFGSKSPLFPHHRLAGSDKIEEPIPGFLVGGPNPGKQDGCDYPSGIPDECYVDDQASYASNEIAINWQALFTYLSVALDAGLEKK